MLDVPMIFYRLLIPKKEKKSIVEVILLLYQLHSLMMSLIYSTPLSGEHYDMIVQTRIEWFSYRGRTVVGFESDGSIQDEGFQFFYFIEDDEGSGQGPIPDPGKQNSLVYRVFSKYRL